MPTISSELIATAWMPTRNKQTPRWSLVLAVGLAAALARADETYVLPSAVPAGFTEIMGNKATSLSVFEYEGRPTLVIFDFPNLVEQGRMFNRLVTLIERIGAPRERVLGNEELAAYIRSVGKTEATLAYGNDFLVGEMVVFFNLAEMGGIALTPQELALRQFLLDRKTMVLRRGFYQAATPRAVVLSLPQQSAGAAGSPPVSELARRTILSHEVSHGEFYTSPAYANFCRQFWRDTMTEKQRSAFRKFLASNGYNSENEEMMINEGQAYLMYTPDSRAFNPKLVGLADSEIAQLRQKFRQGYSMAAQIAGN
jgi:hypothetical protein